MRIPLNLIFGSFCLFFMLYLMISFNAVSYQTEIAWEQYHECVRKIENSHFDPEIITECIQESLKHGYEMMVKEDRVYDETQRYFVKMSYNIHMPILGFEKKREISGYAI